MNLNIDAATKRRLEALKLAGKAFYDEELPASARRAEALRGAEARLGSARDPVRGDRYRSLGRLPSGNRKARSSIKLFDASLEPKSGRAPKAGLKIEVRRDEALETRSERVRAYRQVATACSGSAKDFSRLVRPFVEKASALSTNFGSTAWKLAKYNLRAGSDNDKAVGSWNWLCDLFRRLFDEEMLELLPAECAAYLAVGIRAIDDSNLDSDDKARAKGQLVFEALYGEPLRKELEKIEDEIGTVLRLRRLVALCETIVENRGAQAFGRHVLLSCFSADGQKDYDALRGIFLKFLNALLKEADGPGVEAAVKVASRKTAEPQKTRERKKGSVNG